MGQTRKNHSKEFKAKVALESGKGRAFAERVGDALQDSPAQIAQWKRQLVANAPQVF